MGGGSGCGELRLSARARPPIEAWIAGRRAEIGAIADRAPAAWRAWAIRELGSLEGGGTVGTIGLDEAKDPLERARLGQFFTPEWLAELIVAVAVADGPDGTVLDPACGAGSLLVAVCAARLRAGWTVVDALAGVEGLDRDASAAWACKASLVQWALTGASGDPPADLRVHVADALAADVPGRGFSRVIGNPPFLEAKRMGAAEPGLRDRLRAAWPGLRGAFDLYVPFVLRAMEIVGPDGAVAMILPGKVLQARYATDLRRTWLDDWQLDALVDLTRCAPRPFDSASVYPIIARVGRTRIGTARMARIGSPSEVPAYQTVDLAPIRAIGGDQPLFVPFDTWSALGPLLAGPRLGAVARFVSTCSFHAKGLREQFIADREPEDGGYPYLGSTSYAHRIELDVFRARWAGGWIRAGAWSACRALGNALPDRDAVFARPKVIVAQHAIRPIAAMDPDGTWVTKDTYPVGWPIDPAWTLESLAAVLNSTVFAALYNTFFQGVLVGGETYHYLPAFLHQVPVPIDVSGVDRDAVRALHDGSAPAGTWDRVDRQVAAAYGVDESDRQRMIDVHLIRVGAPSPREGR